MKTTKATGLRRLERLAKFLDKLPREKFNFRDWVTETNKSNRCGTVCCAVGWMPLVDPRSWRWGRRNRRLVVKLASAPDAWPTLAAAEYFGLQFQQVERLFVAPDRATAERTRPTTVARHIRAFIARQRKAS